MILPPAWLPAQLGQRAAAAQRDRPVVDGSMCVALDDRRPHVQRLPHEVMRLQAVQAPMACELGPWQALSPQYNRTAMSKCQVRRISITSNSRASTGGNAW